MPDAGRQGGRPQSDRTLLVTFAPQRQPCLHVERCSASERARRPRDESSRDEGRGHTRCRQPDWPSRGDGGKPNHTPKPIITRSGGWVRPETWTIHGSSATGECRRPHGYNRPLLHLGRAASHLDNGRAALRRSMAPPPQRGPARRLGRMASTGSQCHAPIPSPGGQAFAGRSYPAVGADR
jgi:hypothetical protein